MTVYWAPSRERSWLNLQASRDTAMSFPDWRRWVGEEVMPVKIDNVDSNFFPGS